MPKKRAAVTQPVPTPLNHPWGLSEEVALADLRFDADNARLHPAANVSALKASLREFGQPEPLVVRQDGTVIAGNGRLQAMQELGWEKCQVRRVDWNDAKARAYSLVANQTSLLGEWEPDLLEKQLLDIALQSGLQVEEFGFWVPEGLGDADPLPGSAPAAMPPEGEEPAALGSFTPPAPSEAAAHVKMVQLFFDEQTQDEFYAITDAAAGRLGTTNLTDTVMGILLEYRSQHAAA